tara:strand:+ start:105 stop:503 length:399 start_codon:yes stop_codon:yes gene_type:complete
MTVKNAVKRLREDIHRFIADDDFDNAMYALRDALKATHTVRESRADGERGVQYAEKPCHTTRINAAKLMLEYGFGKPATRAEINITDDTSKSASPAEIMARMRQAGTQLSEIVDVYAEAVDQTPMEIENQPS